MRHPRDACFQMTEEQLEETLWDIDRTAQTSNYGNFELQGQVELCESANGSSIKHGASLQMKQDEMC